MKTRVQLDHSVHYAGRYGATYFVTICCRKRGRNQLCIQAIAEVILESARIYHERRRWQLLLMLLMPDHLHTLINLSGDVSLNAVIRDFKRVTAKKAAVRWQNNFFDHRIRASESLDEKDWYIRENPVRAGLVAGADDWTYRIGPLS